MTESALQYSLFQTLRVHFSSESDPNSILSTHESCSLESNYASTFSMHVCQGETVTRLPVLLLTQLPCNWTSGNLSWTLQCACSPLS